MVGTLSRPEAPVAASVVIVTHDSEQLVAPVLDALFDDPGRPQQVVVVDSASSDGTRELLGRYPGIDVIASQENVGFAAGCHLGVHEARHDAIVFLGHDTVPTRGWLSPLVAALDEPRVGAAMATIEQGDLPGTFNTSGGHLTYFGLAWISDHGVAIADTEAPLVDVAFPSGAAMAITKETWSRFGGFRPEFFMYHEDTDLGWRIRLAGQRVVRVRDSRVVHGYEFGRAAWKMYHLERNRLWMLRSNYRTSTLLLLLPALLVVEAGTFAVAVRDGWAGQKLRAWRDGLTNRAVVRRGRALAESNREIGDAAMLAEMDHRLGSVTQVRPPKGTSAVDAVLGLWKRLVMPVIRLLDRFG